MKCPWLKMKISSIHIFQSYLVQYLEKTLCAIEFHAYYISKLSLNMYFLAPTGAQGVKMSFVRPSVRPCVRDIMLKRLPKGEIQGVIQGVTQWVIQRVIQGVI